MLKFAILFSIFFNYACAGIIFPTIRQAYADSGLTDKQIDEIMRKTAITVIAKPIKLDLDFDIEEVMRSVKKKLTDFFLSFSNQDSKCINRQCLHTKAKPMNGNILFCCCTGNLCNAKFEWVPEEHKDVIPAKDHPDFPLSFSNQDSKCINRQCLHTLECLIIVYTRNMFFDKISLVHAVIKHYTIFAEARFFFSLRIFENLVK